MSAIAPYPAWPLVLTLALGRVLLVLVLCFGALPLLLFPDDHDMRSESIAGRALPFMFLVVAGAHLFALVGLYEGLTILAIFLALALWRFYFALPIEQRQKLVGRINVLALIWIDRVTGRPDESGAAGGLPKARRSWVRPGSRRGQEWPSWLPLTIVILVAAWMRFGSGFAHPALAFSDAPVTLKWMKAFGNGRLFPDGNGLYPDGVYPEGLYALLTFLKKLTMENALLVMVVTGPLVALFIVLSVAGFVRWATGNRLAGAAAALLYGTLPRLTPMEFERQAGYNSQEFGFIFILPAAWFGHKYLVEGQRRYGLMAAAAAGVVIFTHPIPSFILVGVLAATVVAAVTGRSTTWGRTWRLTLWTGLAGVVAITPPVLGLTLLGKSWHGSSLEWLGDTMAPHPGLPPWHSLLLIGLAALAPLLVRENRQALWLALLVMLAAIGVWYLPHMVPIPALQTFGYRSGESGALALGIAAGLAWHLLQRLLPRRLATPAVSAALFGAVAITLWWWQPPSTAEPPRISTDEVIVQALRIDRFVRAGDWTLIMDEPGYVVALGRGEHQYPSDFVAHARPGVDRWCWEEDDGNLLHGSRVVALILDKQSPTAALLQAWVDEHRSDLPLTQTYTSDHLDVWLLNYPADPQMEFDALWGEVEAGGKCSLAELR